MPGFVVGAHDLVAGELWLYVETTADVVGCSRCGARATGHGRARTAVRDLPISGRPTVLMWSKRRWRCPDPDCGVNTWSETTEAIAPRAVLSERARKRLAEMVNIDGDTIAGAAVEFGVGWHTANQAVADYTDPHIDDPDRLEGVTAIGVDEKRFLNATVDHHTVYTTQIVDLDRHRLLDVIQGRSRNVLGNWLSQRGEQWCDRIRLATLDPAAGYRKALTDHLDNATLVVDHFGVPPAGRTRLLCGQGVGGVTVVVLPFDRGSVAEHGAEPAAVVPRFDPMTDRRVRNTRRWTSSFFRVARNDSAGALSQHTPVRPTDCDTP
jgi:transposase